MRRAAGGRRLQFMNRRRPVFSSSSLRPAGVAGRQPPCVRRNPRPVPWPALRRRSRASKAAWRASTWRRHVPRRDGFAGASARRRGGARAAFAAGPSARRAAAPLARHRLRSRGHRRGLRAAAAQLQRVPAAVRAGGSRRPRASGEGDRLEAWMRVRQKHVLTVVLDSTYDVTLRPAGRAGRLQRLAQHADLRARRAQPAAKPGRRARLPVAAEHLLDLGGARRRPLPAGRIRLAQPRHPDRPRLGAAPVCRQRTARVARVHPPLRHATRSTA